MRGFFIPDHFALAFGGGGAGAFLQFAESLHFGLGFLDPSERAIGLGEEEVNVGFGRGGFHRCFKILYRFCFAVQLDESARGPRGHR